MASPPLPLPGPGALRAHHNHSFTLQKYLLLEEQHETLRHHIDQLRPLALDETAAGDAADASPVGSPTAPTAPAYPPPPCVQPSPHPSQLPSVSAGGRYHHHRRRRRSLPPPVRPSHGAAACPETAPDETTLHEVALEEARLFDVNEGIKRALTELLNCDEVRNDRSFRTWVQCRLMDTEKELRVGRRRRSTP